MRVSRIPKVAAAAFARRKVASARIDLPKIGVYNQSVSHNKTITQDDCVAGLMDLGGSVLRFSITDMRFGGWLHTVATP